MDGMLKGLYWTDSHVGLLLGELPGIRLSKLHISITGGVGCHCWELFHCPVCEYLEGGARPDFPPASPVS